jgi:Polysaccharide lyase family 4, domain II
MTMFRFTYAVAVGLALAAAGCSSNDACDPTANTGCKSGQVCEQKQGGGSVCAEPLVVRGHVLKLADGSAVQGARAVALDPNAAPVSSVATSAADGSYELAIPSVRTADGKPVSSSITLRVDASGFQSFPGGIRQALPISIASPVETSGKLVIASALTEVGLLGLDGAGTGVIAGKAQVPTSRAGVLVVAETGAGTNGISAIADTSGDFKIFNVPAGSFTVKAYAKGVNYDPINVNVTAGQTAAANPKINTGKAASQVSGSVNIVNPGTGTATSVILVVESTFNEVLIRGETPPGLRAPDPGVAPNVNNAFTISGVPEGRYVVLAAFENDNLVRDPDTAIGGTQIVHIQVTSGSNIPLPTSFKVTGALDVIGPGKDGPEAVTTKPILTWVDDSSEDGYTVVVYDAFGNVAWGPMNLPKFTGSNPTVQYEGPLDKGMFYQFKATSFHSDVSGTVPISNTEDLRGVFYMP